MERIARGLFRLGGALVFCMLALRMGPPALAASLDGVTVPERETLAGTDLRLNGMGVRTASVFNIHVYVAALFLESPSADAEAIIRSNRLRLLELRFVRDVPVDRIRQAWREAFDRTCHGPCPVPEQAVAQFLAAAPEMHKGDITRFEFTSNTLRILLNGHELGVIHDQEFERIVLATFLGEAPASIQLKKDLLGIKD